MKAIRPIYDGMDDLDERDWIDYIDMMVCMFSQIQEGIDSMEDISAEQKEELRHKVDLEILPTGVISTEKGINDAMYVAEAEDEYDLYNGTGIDELIVMFEIVRWLKENHYEWESAVTPKFKYIAHVLYSDPRVLSLFELMRVMSLPDDWPLPSDANVAFVRSVIGEGIPPLFVKKVFEKIV